MSDGMVDPAPTFQEAWARFFANHPDSTSSWRYQNLRWPDCPCPACDPHQRLPRPSFVMTGARW